MKNLIAKSIVELKSLLESRQVSAQEILSSHLEQAQLVEPKVKAFLCMTESIAREQAKKIDVLIAKKEPLPKLAGIPVAIKDNICLEGYKTTCGSKILEDFIPVFNATVVEKMSEAGALFIGKTNLDEFAMGSSTENSAYGPTTNPWNTQTVPGGSSGGSAASVASYSSVVSLGSDTGGSIRQPASFCGIVGMKPTYGLISRFGLVAFASSLDQIGPFARSVEDAAILLEVISGHDRHDSTSLNIPAVNYMETLKSGVKNMRIGIIEELSNEGIDESVRLAFKQAIKTFESLGAKVESATLPNSKHALPVYYLIANAEASSNLARFDGVKYGLQAKDAKDLLSMYCETRRNGFGPEVKRRIMLGTYALSSGYYDAYYKKAQQVRRLIKNDFDAAFAKFDLLICPTSPTCAFALGAKTSDPLQMYLSDIATIPAPLAGIPGISVPCGFSQSGFSNDKSTSMLPIGLQLLGKSLSDAQLLQAAYAFEQATDFHTIQSPALAQFDTTSQKCS